MYKLQYVKEKSNNYEIDNKINHPHNARDIFNEVFDMQIQSEEILGLLVLNTKNKVIGCFEVSRGSLSSSIVHPREIMKRVLLMNGSSFIMGHNHPSGDPAPSQEDINITKRMHECGKLLGIDLLDHIVVGDGERYASIKEMGVI